MSDIIDLTHLKWKYSEFNADSFDLPLFSAYAKINNIMYYYKLSKFDYSKGIYGHEVINEIVAKNIAEILDIECLQYELIHCKIQIDKKEFTTFVTKSRDFGIGYKEKIAFEEYYRINSTTGETPLDFSLSIGLDRFISKMFLLDWIIYNRDRHGANIEVLINDKCIQMAPLFDHGFSFVFSCYNDGKSMLKFDYLQTSLVDNFIGSPILSENLAYVLPEHREKLFHTSFTKDVIFKGLENAKDAVPKEYWDCVFEMVRQRVNYARRYFLEHPYNPN